MTNLTHYETLPSGIKIVEYDHSLAEGLAEFWNICGQEEDGDWGGDSEISSASQIIAQHNAESNFNVYIALDGEAVVGYCSYSRYYYDANTMYVKLLGVRPDYRSKKIGKALVLRCVQRTIELGYPRLDLYTWAGNTAAVPLYKKCGFLWEDRTDGTHLANFIPSIITAPLFADFFAKADWYKDSTRSLDIVPDGVKTNGFEFFGYSWEKDGDMLNVGYERSGRQMRMIETNHYKIELNTPEQALAFGTDYTCTFTIENKSGNPLDIKITGRQDANITLTCNHQQHITDKQEVTATFHVGEVTSPQDEWKVYPCLLADVEINGQTVTFGLGIDSKFPLTLNLTRECKIDQVGMNVASYLNIRSGFLEGATIVATIPQGEILGLDKSTFTVDIDPKGKASIPFTATTLAIGHEKLDLRCTATFKNGKTITFTVPLFIITRDMTHAFYEKTLTRDSIHNGPWRLDFDHEENALEISHLTNPAYTPDDCDFGYPKLGLPFDDEFNLIRPNITTYAQDGAMVMVLEFVSEKFSGMVVTQTYTLFASGIITLTNTVENRGDSPRATKLQFSCWIKCGIQTAYSYKGRITQNDDPHYPGTFIEGLDSIASEDLDENWIMENTPNAPKGYVWPKAYKPTIQWGAGLIFDIDLGELAPGQTFTTLPITAAMGLFDTPHDLRNYALQINQQDPAHSIKPIEVVVNGYNPIATTDAINIDLHNNRDSVDEGTITVSANGNPPQSQTNPHETLVEKNSFTMPVVAGINNIHIQQHMVGYEREIAQSIFRPSGTVTTAIEGTSYQVSNGAITFKVDPNYSRGCYSLTDAKGQEWLHSQYPEHKPYSWFNPYLGGVRICTIPFNDRALLKEKTTAAFVSVTDNFGNQWQGICSTVTVTEDEKLKGAVYKSYFLTLPGLPVFATFYQFHNLTGEYRADKTWIGMAIKPGEDAKEVFVDTTTLEGAKRRRRMGALDVEDIFFQGAAAVTSPRAEILYALGRDSNMDIKNEFWGDNKFTLMMSFAQTHARAPHGQVYTSNPAFIVIADQALPANALSNLERVEF